MALTACGGGGGGGGEGGSGDSGGGTAPSISISSPTANSETTSTISLSGSCDSTISSISISGDVSSPSSTTCTSGSFSVTITLSGADGSKSVTVSQTNSSGTGTDSRTFVLSSATDPLYAYAWHLENTGQNNFATNSGTAGIDINVKNVFAAGIKGTGVTIAVSDSGIETGHEDLTDNYTTGISKNFLLSSPYNGDPVYNSANDGHGTAVTGLISAEGWNDLGSRGVSPNSKFGGFNTLATGVTQSIDMILYQMTGSFDVFNYSYGLTPCAYQGMGSNSTERTSIINAFEAGVTSLRSGKGSIYVKSAGNQFISDPKECLPSLTGWETYYVGNSTWLENNNFPYLVVVGAVNADGEKSSYSNQGPNIWISAPGGEFGSTDPAIMTTDISGCSAGISESTNTKNDFEDGHALNTTCSYTSTMNGTSSAAPIVSGVVALILEANPNLTWRDVKHILASTATINDSFTGFYTHPFGYDLAGHTYQTRWVQNTAGYYFHNYYGFGLANAEAAVTMAQNYTADLGTFAQLTDPNTGDWTYDSGTISQSIPNNSSTGTSNSITVNHNFIVEAVQVRLSVTHNYVENLGIELTSPGGTKSIITNINSAVLDINIADKILMTNAFYGEESKGAWTIG